jgi:hypothetical protein
MRTYLAILMGTLLANLSHAQAPIKANAPKADPRITSIVTGGYWQTDADHGTYRILLYQTGYEHVSTGVVAQWIAEGNAQSDPQRIVHELELVASGLHSFQDASIAAAKAGVRVLLRGVNTYQTAKPASCTFSLLPNQTATTVKPCG